MKTIKMPLTVAGPAAEILRIVLAGGGANGMTVSQVRARLRILDKIGAADDGKVTLNDEEHATVKAIYDAHPFAIAHPDVVAIADAIDGAVEG